MARIDIDDEVWARFRDLCHELDIADPVRYLEQWIRRGIKLQDAADGRYWPAACALVTRGEDQVLLVGNEYVKGQPLAWNLPGGVADPGEDLHQTVRRELGGVRLRGAARGASGLDGAGWLWRRAYRPAVAGL